MTEKEIIQQIANARLRKGWSGNKAAIASGLVAHQFLSIERGESRPTTKILLQICNALDLKLEIKPK